MRSSDFFPSRKIGGDGGLPALIDDFLKPASYPPSGRRSSTIPSISSASGTAQVSLHSTLSLRFPENLGEEFDAPFARSIGSAAIASISSGTATPENGSACIAALPSPKRLTHSGRRIVHPL